MKNHQIVNESKSAVVLMSGGLDSALAAQMLKEQGIRVHGLFFNTGFCVQAHKKKKGVAKEPDIVQVAESLQVPLDAVDISEEFMRIVTNPKHGWGKNINPCIDCRILMLQKAKEYAANIGADFIATGEIVGQRPKSQKKNTMRLIEKESGLEGKLLRPLSAKCLPPTEMEKSGIVNREFLGSISGRSRREQIALQKLWGVAHTASPGGGCCFLTDPIYAARYKDLLREKHALGQEALMNHDDVVLLGTGRHIKIRCGLKLLVGRNEGENHLLFHYGKNGLFIFSPEDIPAPTSMIQCMEGVPSHGEDVCRNFHIQNFSEESCFPLLERFINTNHLTVAKEELLLCGKIHARYSDAKSREKTKVIYRVYDSSKKMTNELSIEVEPFLQQEVIHQWFIGGSTG